MWGPTPSYQMLPHCHRLRKVWPGAVPTPGCLSWVNQFLTQMKSYDEEAILQPFASVSHQLWVDECVKVQNTGCGASLCGHKAGTMCGWMRLRFRVSTDTRAMHFSAVSSHSARDGTHVSITWSAQYQNGSQNVLAAPKPVTSCSQAMSSFYVACNAQEAEGRLVCMDKL